MHLVTLFGPQAVGKMAVGRRIAALTPYRLFHNHATIDPFLDVFDYGTPSFERLRDGTRQRVIEEAIVSGLPGLLFTFVWPLDLPEETAYVERLLAPVVEAGGRLDFVELWAPEETRMTREGTAERLAAKPSKRDQEWARRDTLESPRQYRLSTGPDVPFPLPHPHTRLDTTHLTADEAAREVIERLRLPRRVG